MYYKIKTIKNHNFEKYKEFNMPLLIENGCNDMDAIKKWNNDYLKKKFKKNIFDVQYFKNITDSETTNVYKVEKINFEEYLNVINKIEPHYYLAGKELEMYKNNISNDIFKDLKMKMDDYRKPVQHMLFIGNNSKSGCHLHCDWDYAINQIFGKKTVYLFDYYDNIDLKIHSINHHQYNFITKNFFRLNHKLYKIYKVTLVPGNTLLIPPWWFHAVENNGYSCSVTKTFYRSHYYLFKKPMLLYIYIILNKFWLFPRIIILFILIFILFKLKNK